LERYIEGVRISTQIREIYRKFRDICLNQGDIQKVSV